MTPARRETFIGLAWVSAIVVIWSAFHLSGRIGAQMMLTPFDLTTLRISAAGIVLAPWLIRHGLGGLKFWQALILAISAGPGFSFFAFAGYMFAPAAHGATILAGALPLFTAPLAWWLAGERMGPARFLSVMLIVSGTAFLLFDATVAGMERQWLGDLFFFAGAASWSVFGVLARRWRVSPTRSAAIVATFSFAIFTPIHLLFLPSTLFVAPWQEILAQWLFQGFVVFFGSTFGYPRAVAALGATPTATIVAFVPGSVAVLAWIFLGEALTMTTGTGVMLVVLGMLAGSLRLNWRRAPGSA